MKKKIILRGVFGFPLGIALEYFITILISLSFAGGYYSPCVPELAAAMGSEIHAVLLQAFLSGLLGAGFAASSVIWDIENWSIVKQTGIYFAVISVIMLPMAYCMYWMEHSIGGFFSYFAIFALVFLVIWLVQFMIGKRNVKKLNNCLHKKDGG